MIFEHSDIDCTTAKKALVPGMCRTFGMGNEGGGGRGGGWVTEWKAGRGGERICHGFVSVKDMKEAMWEPYVHCTYQVSATAAVIKVLVCHILCADLKYTKKREQFRYVRSC